MFGKSEDREDYQHTGGVLAAMARDLAHNFHIPLHRHRRAQLIYGATGSIIVSTDLGQWVVPPHRAVWIPADVEHEMRTSGFVEMRTIYVEQAARKNLLPTCQVMTVRPLLKELIREAVLLPIDYVKGGRDERIVELILDELEPLEVQPLHLPWPTDKRARAACSLLIESLSENIGLREIGAKVGASQRTLERLFPRETGLTCAEWRRQARLMHAVELLSKGEAVSSVALSVGYESVSAFSAIFRTHFGMRPSTYFSTPS